MGLFGKSASKDPKEQVSEWDRKIRKEGYQLDRQIRGIQREEEKVKRSLKEAAKKNDRDTCKILAKEIVRARKAITKIHTAKAHLNSIKLQLKNQLAMLKVTGALSSSTEVMRAMQSLVKFTDIAETMQTMSREMIKAGIIEEMVEESLDTLEDSEQIEDDAQEEIDKVLWEITEGKLGEAPVPSTKAIVSDDGDRGVEGREKRKEREEREEPLEEIVNESEQAELKTEQYLEEMRNRLSAIRM